MNITVVGTGYVGLTTGTCFAEMGNDVICIDIDEDNIDRLQHGELPIYEPGLETYVQRNLVEGRLHFSIDFMEGLRRSDVIFFTLPTSSNPDGSADLSQILAVANRIAMHLLTEVPPRYRIVVNKSTVPVGTTDKLIRFFSQAGIRTGVDVDVVANPEFLREGTAISDFLKPDRVIVGTSSPRAGAVMKQLYQTFVRQGIPILIMDTRSAEMTKYAANALLATRITFMNEIANLCERLGGDVENVRVGIGSDHRIGNKFLYPGIGFGGSGFPSDIRALLDAADRCGYEFPILEAVLSINRRQRLSLSHRLNLHYAGALNGVRVALWGLSFKPNTNDIRESAAHEVVRDLLDKGAHICVFDPVAVPASREVFKDAVEYAQTAYDALQNADVLLICTEWSEFRRPNWDEVKRRMRRPLVFDGRNLYEPRQMAADGIDYFCIGRPHIPPSQTHDITASVAAGLSNPTYMDNGSADS